MFRFALSVVSVFALAWGCSALAAEKNLVQNPSFEQNAPGDTQTLFPGWTFTTHEGQCDLRVSPIAHSGKSSAMLVGSSAPKCLGKALNWNRVLSHHRVSSWARDWVGHLELDHAEFRFDGSDNEGFFQLEKNGTFGWTKLSYVGEVKTKKQVPILVWTLRPATSGWMTCPWRKSAMTLP